MKGNKNGAYGISHFILWLSIGLFCVCAQQRATVSSGDEAVADDEYKQQILQLLQLTEEGTPPATPPGEVKTAATTPEPETKAPPAGDEDVVSLLLASDQQTTPTPPSEPAPQKDDIHLSKEMFAQVQEDISRLERQLERKTASIDSLRRLIENRDRRLKELESQPRAQTTPTSRKASDSRLTGRKKIDPAFISAYQLGRSQFEQFNYQAAIQTFQKLLADFPNHVMADNCQYWIGECYFGMKQYQQAIIEFQKVFSFSETNKHDDAQLMIAISYLRSGQTEKAQQEFEKFLNNYSTSEYASIAKRYYRMI